MKCEVGVDEAGRGPLAGPLSTCACWLQPEWTGEDLEEEKCFRGIRDSKLFTKSSKKLLQERARIADFLKRNSSCTRPLEECNVLYSNTMIPVARIDEIHILNATFEGWVTDVKNVQKQLQQRFPNHRVKLNVIIDGNRIPAELQDMMSNEFHVTSVVKADATVKACSAASIIAKETRDRYMKELATHYPEYGLGDHMGYGTDEHTLAIHRYGKIPGIHRYFDIPNLKECVKRLKKRGIDVDLEEIRSDRKRRKLQEDIHSATTSEAFQPLTKTDTTCSSKTTITMD
jgi:ribonuclease HII